ncbi:glucokinase [Primorskyibacter sp. S187A]|uniref:glucokinase n=1 Tax=Primorskyibacter sp. S187A TaxID=3415130 RepID=UPI003C7A4BD6
MAVTTLVIDIGGTNTRVALAQGTALQSETIKRYRNATMPGLGAVIADYLAQSGARPDAACAAGAGPVRDGVLRLTNLDWAVDRETLSSTGAQAVSILNDLQAQGHALDALPDGALTTLIAGKEPASAQAAKLVVNVGTGMNVAPVYRLKGQTLVPPAEAGHVALAAQTAQERGLVAYIEARHQGFASVEEALSGRGLETIYAYIAQTPKPAAEIMGTLDSDPHAKAALKLFCEVFGRVSGDLTLTHLPFGGVYLVGGVALHTLPHLMANGFGAAFRDKGRFSEFMDQFAVHAVTDDCAALIGCAAHMAEIMGEPTIAL